MSDTAWDYSLNIDLENTIITNERCLSICLSIVEFLLFNRNQIPFVFDSLKRMVEKIEKSRTAEISDGTVRNYAIDRQRDIAIQTTKKFAEISDVINSTLCFSFRTFYLKYKNCFYSNIR